MNTIAYCSPHIPVEWIAAHGLRPLWLRLRPCADGDKTYSRRGVCPVAGMMVDAVCQGLSAAAMLLTTTCDQIRYAAALLEHMGKMPVFLMHVPRTRQSSAAREFYHHELLRISQFFVEYGGKCPTEQELYHVMVQYDNARTELLLGRDQFSAADYAEALIRMRGDLRANQPSRAPKANNGFIPLALVGGPNLESDREMLQIIESAGGRVVLDATETGERTLPAPFDPARLQSDPFEELVRAYFDAIPDVFHRPNDALYEWLQRQIAVRKVRGILLRRHLWCDLWHAELPRLRQELSVPLLEWDCAADDPSARWHAVSRLEAFVEMLL